ncbi:MAG: aminotransferase class V-fold PLP-dependent enzyme [Micrococcales bacterium]|nr:aminotransferase class V-fold PLP-dependent enzyme [Micrococcales bacterium]
MSRAPDEGPPPSATPVAADRRPPARGLLDAAATPLHPVAREVLHAAVDQAWADPRRLYSEARQAAHLLETARATVADGLGVRPAEVSFLPDGPTALSTALDGVLHARRRRPGPLVASAVEHRVALERLEAERALDPDAGRVARVDRLGRVDLAALGELVPGARAVAVQHANGEVGTLQPLPEVHEVCRGAGTPLVVDAQASLGRVAPPAAYDVLVGSASSWGGPPLGVLVVREGAGFALPGPRREAEGGRALAAPWVPLALAAAEAWQQTAHDLEEERAEAHALIERLRQGLAAVPDVEVVGDPVARLPHVLTFSALYVDAERLVGALDREGLALASGSACTASTLEPSHVLAAMGALTHGNVRVTLPLRSVAPDRAEQVERLAAALPAAVEQIRAALGVRGL